MRRSMILGFLFCFITLPTYSQGLLDDYDARATQGISMRCLNANKVEYDEFRLTSDGLFMNNVQVGFDERRGNVVAGKVKVQIIESSFILDFDERIRVIIEELAEGYSREDLYDLIMLNGGDISKVQEVVSLMGQRHVAECL